MSETAFFILFPLIAIPIGIYAGLGIWVPSLRGKWQGTNRVAGPVSCAGFALLFGCGGIIFPILESIPMRNRIWAASPAILGLILAFIGFFIDLFTQANKSE